MNAARKSKTRPPLSHDRIINAAVALADEEGMEALSMRRLGQSLGVEAMSLYNHVAGKEALVDGMVDRVFTEIRVPSEGAPWVAEMRRYAFSKREALERHPWATGLLESRTSPGPENMRHHEALVGCLLNAGLTATEAVRVYVAIGSYVSGFAVLNVNAPWENAAEQQEAMEAVVQSMPVNDYPNSTEVVLELMRTGYEHADEFEWGLDVLLDGLRAAFPDQ